MIKEAKATVMVSDMSRAISFYADVLGLKLLSRYDDWWAELAAPGLTIALHPQTERGPKPGVRGSISLGFQVDDLDKAVADLARHGVKSTRVEEGFVRQANFTDPDGTSLYFAEVKASGR